MCVTWSPRLRWASLAPVSGDRWSRVVRFQLTNTGLSSKYWREGPPPLQRFDTFESEGLQKSDYEPGLPQLERPTFMPVFSSLRRICLERSQDRLRTLEASIGPLADGPERNNLIDQAMKELRVLDRQFNAITDQHQLEDPGYAKQRGLSLVHFTLDDGVKKGDWMLVSGSTGKRSTSTTERDTSKLSSTSQTWLKEFCDDREPAVAFKRHKTLLEKQRGVFIEQEKHVFMNRRTKNIWAFVLAFGCFAQVAFLGVGIIAMTTTLNEMMIKYMYWVCLLWIIMSSSLLVLLVRALGASGKDCLSAFLAAVAIWLVVVQIGQTKLNGQLGVNSN
jgi:hypothetical protein